MTKLLWSALVGRLVVFTAALLVLLGLALGARPTIPPARPLWVPMRQVVDANTGQPVSQAQWEAAASNL